MIRFSERGRIIIFFLLISGFLLVGFWIYSIKTKNVENILPSQEPVIANKMDNSGIHPPGVQQSERVNYDFEKILNENFLLFKNDSIGFSIAYPPEIIPYIYNKKDAQDKFGHLNWGEEPDGAVNFSLLSQPEGADEIYDGLSLDVIYYKSSVSNSMNKMIGYLTDGYDSKTQQGTELSGSITIDGIKGYRLVNCCYGGGTNIYLFPVHNNGFFIEIDVFSPGQESEKFNQVADKMLNSFKLVN